MDNLAHIDQNKNNTFMANQCEEKAKIYEDTHQELNAIYLRLFETNGVSIEVDDLHRAAKKYLVLADREWLAKRQYEKGEI